MVKIFKLCAYAEKLIKAHEIEAAIYLNKIINVMGSSVDFGASKIKSIKNIQNLKEEFVATNYILKVVDYQYNDSAPVHSLVELHHGKIKRSF